MITENGLKSKTFGIFGDNFPRKRHDWTKDAKTPLLRRTDAVRPFALTPAQ